jgi:hypothetical protein
MEQCPVPPDHFSTLVNLIAKGEVTEKMARVILEEMFEKSVSPEAVIESTGLKPIQDSGALEQMGDDLLAKNPLYSLIGLVMKKTRGKADPDSIADAAKSHCLRVQGREWICLINNQGTTPITFLPVPEQKTLSLHRERERVLGRRPFGGALDLCHVNFDKHRAILLY